MQTTPGITNRNMPDVSTSYGYKYCVAFGQLLKGKLSPQGNAWIDKTLLNLQTYMEKGVVDNSWKPQIGDDFIKKYVKILI